MDLFEEYLTLGNGMEPPRVYHRWAVTSAIATLLGRRCFIPFGHGKIYPHMYVMLVGKPGTRKSTAIGLASKLLRLAGYHQFAPDKVSKEKFLVEMIALNQSHSEDGEIDLLAELDKLHEIADSEILIDADEFNDFMGQANGEFLMMLGKIWDCSKEEYRHPKLRGDDVIVPKPIVNILAGNTHTGIMQAFPPEAVGTGWMSRVLFVNGKESGRRITFPEILGEDRLAPVVAQFKSIRELKGAFTLSADARKVADEIYQNPRSLGDYRFKHYESRRFTHLLKLSMIMAAADLRVNILARDVIRANTQLYFAEKYMPEALGEYGKSRDAEATNTVLDALDSATEPLTIRELWKIVSSDVKSLQELGDLVGNLISADKVQTFKYKGHSALIRKKTVMEEWPDHLIDDTFLHEEEKLM